MEEQAKEDDKKNEDKQIEENKSEKRSLVKVRSEISQARSGVSTLLQIDEMAELQHGTTVLRPSINIGTLLEPLEEENIEIHSVNESISEHTDTPIVIEFDEFISFAEVLGYSSSDLSISKQIYSVINEADKSGITMATLMNTVYKDIHIDTQMSVKDIVQDLINFGLVS